MFRVRRILIIGSGGAGKSTLALQLGQQLGLPVHHLDRIFWKPGWESIEQERFVAEVEAICAQPEWVIDGNYSSTFELRFPAADTIIFLSLSRWVCLWRVLKRRLRYHRATRPDVTDGCPEQLERQFLLWICNYPRTRTPRILERLRELPSDKQVIVLRSPREVAAFARNLHA